MSKDIPGNRNNKKAILISYIFLIGERTVLYLCEIPDFGNGTIVIKEYSYSKEVHTEGLLGVKGLLSENSEKNRE